MYSLVSSVVECVLTMTLGSPGNCPDQQNWAPLARALLLRWPLQYQLLLPDNTKHYMDILTSKHWHQLDSLDKSKGKQIKRWGEN